MQPEMLKSFRLDVPVIPRLIKNLRDSGIVVSMAYTFEEARQSFLYAFGKRL
jgi:cobalt/nickel transport system ATP-binding protein